MYTGTYREYVAAAEEALFPVTVPWQAASEVHNCESSPLNGIIQIEDYVEDAIKFWTL
jgi:hypothetical protein